MLNIVLFGPPGAGKGTQSKMILAKYRLIHLSTGDLLHREVMAKTALGLQAKKLMLEGKLVPNEVVINMIDNKFKANQTARGFVFDGFPRTLTQAQALDQILDDNRMALSKVISLEVEAEELVRRVLQRGKEKGRFDDQNESIVRNRLKNYLKETSSIAKYYQQKDIFVSISGIGSVEDIFAKICQEVDSIPSIGSKTF